MRSGLVRAVVFAVCCSLFACPPPPCRSRNAGVVPPTPEDPPVTCPVSTPADTLAANRAACEFTAGASAAQTLGIDAVTARSIPVRHVIVVMKENRSFDHLLGRLHEQGQDAAEGIPADFVNLDAKGFAVAPFRASTTCLENPEHQWNAMHEGVNGGAMDGFVKTAGRSTGSNGHFAMSLYERDDLPFFYWVASTWALSDRHFGALRSGTIPNRLFMLLGTNDGVKETNFFSHASASTPSILDSLTAAGLTWGAYADGEILEGALRLDHDSKNCGCFSDFIERLDTGTLPNVAFVDARANVDDDHPPADLQRGEAWLAEIYAHAVKSPQWPRLAIIWTYDESGGFFDHVPPPNRACVARPIAKDAPYFELGVRVPLVVVSPYAKPHFVSHVTTDHTAITRFIETVFELPALTARDANSTALLDLFDFSCTPPMLTPPEPPAPGVGGCQR